MFEDYAVIPLDVPLPPVAIEALRAFVQSRCESCAFTDNNIRYVAFDARKPIVDGKLFLHAADPRVRQTAPETEFDWDPVFRQELPGLMTWAEELPFERLHGITLVTQTDHIREHLDVFGNHNSVSYYEAYRELEPIYYRVVLCEPGDDVSRNECFYVTFDHGGHKHFVRLPPETSTVAMSSSTCYHGAVHHPGRYKTTVVIYGSLDRERHLGLLRRSLERFPEYAIKLPAPGPVGGPGAVRPYRGA